MILRNIIKCAANNIHQAEKTGLGGWLHSFSKLGKLALFGALIVVLTLPSCSPKASIFPKNVDQIVELAHWRLDSISHVAWSRNGTQLAAGAISAEVGYYNPETLQVVRVIKTSSKIDNIVFSPDDRVLAYTFINTPKLVWDVASGKALKLTGVDMNSLWSGVFSPDGKLLASQSLNGDIQIWDLADGRELHTLKGNTYQVNLVVFSSDSSLIATVAIDGNIGIWDVASGKQLHSWGEEPYLVMNLTFSPDNILLASGLMDGSVLLWNTDSGKKLNPLIGHEDIVNSVAFSPDGRMLASGSRDKTIKLWDLTSRSELRTLRNPYEVYFMGFSPDGRMLAVTSFDYPEGMVQLWGLQQP